MHALYLCMRGVIRLYICYSVWHDTLSSRPMGPTVCPSDVDPMVVCRVVSLRMTSP